MLELDIDHYYTNAQSASKCSYAEEGIKILKMALGRVLEDGRANVLDKVQAIVRAHNDNSASDVLPPHVAPSDLLLQPSERTRAGASSASIAQLTAETVQHRRLYRLRRDASVVRACGRPKYVVGQHVRIDVRRVRGDARANAFGKVSDRRWTAQVYTIAHVFLGGPLHTYALEEPTQTGARLTLPGTFDEDTLVAAY